jgi:hypothetical protein
LREREKGNEEMKREERGGGKRGRMKGEGRGRKEGEREKLIIRIEWDRKASDKRST